MGEKFLLVDYGVSDSIDAAYTLFSSQEKAYDSFKRLLDKFFNEHGLEYSSYKDYCGRCYKQILCDRHFEPQEFTVLEIKCFNVKE